MRVAECLPALPEDGIFLLLSVLPNATEHNRQSICHIITLGALNLWEEPENHIGNLIFACATKTGDGDLDLTGRKLEQLKLVFGAQQVENSSQVAKLQKVERMLAQKRRFKRERLHLPFNDLGIKKIMKLSNPLIEWCGGLEFQAAMIKKCCGAWPLLRNGKAGKACAWINAKKSHKPP